MAAMKRVLRPMTILEDQEEEEAEVKSSDVKENSSEKDATEQKSGYVDHQRFRCHHGVVVTTTWFYIFLVGLTDLLFI